MLLLGPSRRKIGGLYYTFPWLFLLLLLLLFFLPNSSHRFSCLSWFRPDWVNSSSSLSRSRAPRSGWLAPDGFMRLDADDPLGSYYALRMRDPSTPPPHPHDQEEDSMIWHCDRIRTIKTTIDTTSVTAAGEAGERASGTLSSSSSVVCENTMTYLSLLRDWALAQGQPEQQPPPPQRLQQDPSTTTAPTLNFLPQPPTALTRLTGKRALILGDSVDRYMLTHLRDVVLSSEQFEDTNAGEGGRFFSGCEMDDPERLIDFDTSQGSPRMVVLPLAKGGGQGFDFARDVQVNTNNYNQVPPSLPLSPHRRQLVDIDEPLSLSPRHAAVANDHDPARSQLRIDFLHMYGTDDDDLWQDRQSHHLVTAWRTRDRLEKVKTMWGHGPGVYDVIFINFGLWELARYQRTAYALYGNDDELGLPQEWLEDYRTRLRSYVDRIQTTWHGTRVVIRPLHDPRINAGGWFRPAGMDMAGDKKAPFTRLRVVQLRRVQIQVARELGVEVLGWADLMLGQDDGWLRDEIHPNVPGSLVLAEMYLRFLAVT